MILSFPVFLKTVTTLYTADFIVFLPIIDYIQVAVQVDIWRHGLFYNSYFNANQITTLVLTLDQFFTASMPFFYDRYGNKI